MTSALASLACSVDLRKGAGLCSTILEEEKARVCQGGSP